MRLIVLGLLFCHFCQQGLAQPNVMFLTPFETDPNYSAPYERTISYYRELAEAFPELEMREYGKTDSGQPLHLMILSIDQDFEAASIHAKDKTILMINNAIHPGEPCGVDASMMFLRDLLLDDAKQQYLENLVIIVIPFYNISGGLNRGAYSRANQEGPAEHGFRGNARNYDLNRDFIKCDTRNAQTFNQIFQEWEPHVFIDNHTSNGADYQYTLTLIPTQKDKLQEPLASLLVGDMLPDLYAKMQETPWEMIPYVYARTTPDEGIAGFLDLPRYSSGYTALHHTIGFMPETHMLKPFEDRVWSVYQFMDQMVVYLAEKGGAVRNAKRLAINQTKAASIIELNWKLDFSKIDSILFKGFEAGYKPSAISGLDRLYYDRAKPYEKTIPFFNTYTATLSVEKPKAYVIPQAYTEVIERLQWNGVELTRINESKELDLEFYYIRSFETVDQPYEGHYLHSKVEVEKVRRIQKVYPGDYLVETGQASDLYIVSVLEPQGPDSYFAWNFFDGILMQKEYFSDYVFEDLAAEMLEKDPELKKAFENARKENPEMAESARAQLDWIYKHSPYYEPTYQLYPVGRMVK
ncbi:MAG: hypothetical protein KDC34_06780 [Saprospiraceae bacterium]|nr:hypothetical protein [Saprospiraceae bacterium]